MHATQAADRLVQHNKQVHDAVVASYEAIHVEIYNPTEQRRISEVLGAALNTIETGAEPPLALDFGAGTGNLTQHLLAHGAGVIAADVSAKSLDFLKLRFPDARALVTMELNGEDLSGLDDESVDLVATYSVLHHVPDYLEIVKEFARVVKPGGVICIDHEVAPSHWEEPTEAMRAYRRELAAKQQLPPARRVLRKVGLLASPRAWKRLINRKVYGLNEEGDIHVTREDHIEWDKIEALLSPTCEVIKREDYLVCREREADAPLYRKYAGQCADMRVLVCKKRK